MTKSELSETSLEAHEQLGFVIDEYSTGLWDLMRQTTRRRARAAIGAVADDVTCHNVMDRHNRLLQLLRKPMALPRK